MNRQTLALQRGALSSDLTWRPIPELKSGQLLLEMLYAGICRTDLAVAEGRVQAAKQPITLGHEAVARVALAGPRTLGSKPGTLVALKSWNPCLTCPSCLNGNTSACPHARLMGRDEEGLFCRFAVVEADRCLPFQDSTPPLHAAFLEPVAACSAILKAPIKPYMHGAVWGDNRIAHLCFGILQERGFKNLTWVRGDTSFKNEFDFAVETHPNQIGTIIQALRPGGRLILKSRSQQPQAVDLSRLVEKEISLSACHYGQFTEAVPLIESKSLALDELIGSIHPLENYAEAFEQAKGDQRRKTFLKLQEVS